MEVLHFAALLARPFLDLALGAPERIVHREGRIGKPLVVMRGVIDVDVDMARQRDVDVDAEEVAAAVMAVGNLHDHLAGREAAMKFLKCVDMFGDERVQSFARRAALVADPYRCFHYSLRFWSLPRLENVTCREGVADSIDGVPAAAFPQGRSPSWYSKGLPRDLSQGRIFVERAMAAGCLESGEIGARVKQRVERRA